MLYAKDDVQVPFVGMNEAKRSYFTQDLRDWCQYAGIKLNFPRAFPLRTVLPLRATLASNCDPVIIKMLCMCYGVIFVVIMCMISFFFFQTRQHGKMTSISEKKMYNNYVAIVSVWTKVIDLCTSCIY